MVDKGNDGTLALHDLEPVIDRLYEAITDFTKWVVFLKECSMAFDATGASVNIFDADRSDSVFHVLHNIDPEILGRYIEHAASDPRMPLWDEKPGMPLSDHLELPQTAFDGSSLYTDVMRPGGIEYGLGVHLPMEGVRAGFVLFRPPGARVFDENEVARFGILVPHFRRAAMLIRQFLRLEKEKWAALGILDKMPLGLAVADFECRLLHANVAAQQLFQHQDGLLLRYGQLWGDTPGVSTDLRSAIRQAVEGTAPHQTMILPRRQGSPLLVRVGALRRDSLLAGQPITLGQSVAVLYVTDPDRPQETMLDLLQRLYGLTPREVELSALLAKGKRLEDCVEEMDISMSTARTYLRAIFEKSGALTQADLVRLVLSAPVWTPPKPDEIDPWAAG